MTHVPPEVVVMLALVPRLDQGSLVGDVHLVTKREVEHLSEFVDGNVESPG